MAIGNMGQSIQETSLGVWREGQSVGNLVIVAITDKLSSVRALPQHKKQSSGVQNGAVTIGNPVLSLEMKLRMMMAFTYLGFCNCRVSRHAHRVARSTSPHPLLAGFPPSDAPRAQNLGRNGPMDAYHRDRLALWPPAQSSLLERASARQLVGAGSLGRLAAAHQRCTLSVWGWQSRRQTRDQESCGAERAHQPASALVFWPPLRPVARRVGWVSRARELSAYCRSATPIITAKTPCFATWSRLSPQVGQSWWWWVGMPPMAQGQHAHGPRPGRPMRHAVGALSLRSPGRGKRQKIKRSKTS